MIAEWLRPYFRPPVYLLILETGELRQSNAEIGGSRQFVGEDYAGAVQEFC